MFARCSWGSYKFRSTLDLIYRYRFSSRNVGQGLGSSSAVAKAGQSYPMHLGLQLISANSEKWSKFDAKMVKDDEVGPSAPTPPSSNFAKWAKWVLGTILSVLLPFWKLKWEKLRRIEGEAEIIVEEVEHVAEVVEKVATVAEHVSDKVAERLPENGKLKESALLIERASKATADGAKQTEDFIHKADALKHDFDDLKTMVEPVIEKLKEQEKSGKK